MIYKKNAPPGHLSQFSNNRCEQTKQFVPQSGNSIKPVIVSNGRQQASVNFTNILRAAFLHESFLCSFYVLTIWVCNFFGKRILAQKLLIQCWWNWHLLSSTVWLKKPACTRIFIIQLPPFWLNIFGKRV